jgi:putative hemolysin
VSEGRTILNAPCTFPGKSRKSLRRKANGLVSYSFNKLLSMDHVGESYRKVPYCNDPFDFSRKTLESLGVNYSVSGMDEGTVPASGAVIVVSNHPFGGIDGLILISLLSKVREDVRVLVNFLLGAIAELQPIFLLVDPFGSREAVQKNRASLAGAVRWLGSGGMLVTFPAGEVSRLSLSKRNISDPPWHSTLGRLIHMSKASVVPVYFKGSNSVIFHAAGLLHPLLRTAMLPRELLKKRDSRIQLRIGNFISYRRLASIQDPTELTSYLRFRSELLGKSLEKPRRILSIEGNVQKSKRFNVSISSSEHRPSLQEEVNDLPKENLLEQNGSLCVYYASARRIPAVLREIGRLREETFRKAGEGTGKAIDLDRFDERYHHLFLWNEREKEVVGACRLGRSDEILKEIGKGGLYTHTLFRYSDRFFQEMGPALELGRTFNREEYQRSYSAFLLLWKGIGQYLAQNPRYKVLFGAVSISNDYRSCSRDLMVAFLKSHYFLPRFSSMVRPRNPYKRKIPREFTGAIEQAWGRDLEEVSSWISGLEEGNKGIPILLKHYLKLGGKLVCFNLDPDFGHVLDGLILVDVLSADHRILSRYMGEDALKCYRDYHVVGKRASQASDASMSNRGKGRG